jgi:hypothetical protein
LLGFLLALKVEVPPEHWTVPELCGVKTQEAVLFIVIAVRTSSPDPSQIQLQGTFFFPFK